MMMMDASPKVEPSGGAVLSCDAPPAASTSSVLTAAHQVEQAKEPTPVLLYPISINSAVSLSPVFRDKGSHVGGREEVRKAGGARGYTEAVSTSSEFTHHAIVHLIEAMHRCWDVYGSRERSRLFQSVQSELETLGHSLPVEKIRRKWNNLIVTYKRVKERSRLGGGRAKTSWEYFEMMDKVLGKTKIDQRGPASATLVGFATTAKAAVRSEERQSHSSVSVAAVATPCLLPNGLFTSPPQIPTLVTSPLLCNVPPPKTNPVLPLNPKPSPSPTRSSDSSMPSISPKPTSRVVRQPLKRRLRHLQLSSVASRLAQQQQGQAGERTALLRSFLTSQEERTLLEDQRQRKIDAREKRQEKTINNMAEALGRMATALELISSKQDTIIALLQRLADKH
ncbi:uncharacterized protein si:ch1073-357b18.4 [Astyanax mexicanus]|uniref:uncharacterized protein si:ch1073-357b18.4 n=1 Tax=Astyanax mexicanus TaxID=7994 RepID=UPI0020CB2AA8|nr:uncharacterized protein si:ch1073-357b18.4 [Astyanax mexicanus]